MDSTIRLWDINTGKEINTFVGRAEEFNPTAFSTKNSNTTRQEQEVDEDTEKLKKVKNTGAGIRTFIYIMYVSCYLSCILFRWPACNICRFG